MRTSYLLTALTFVAATSLSASTRNHSYITYDAGDDSVVVQADDRREISARTNMPVFPGDEIRTGRRGRVEVRLADGNIVAIDRNSEVEFRSIRDSYDGESERTAIENRYGTVMLQRLQSSRSPVRVDTEMASYVLSRDGIMSLESAGRSGDILSVYEGSVEIRTEAGSDRARAGEELRIDRDGVYASNEVVDAGTTDFERWFMRRSGRYRNTTSRYLDSRLAYADSDFSSHGSWVYVSDYSSWVWRPRVSVGWRPYYHGYWRHSPGGSLVWVSDEPWGWVPYHYGRWAWTPVYGWVWLPGSGYSPAWVYWAYGPSYVGWVPAGWYDCYRPYYDWVYRPYARSGAEIAIGFNGRVRLGDVDLRGWTFVDSNKIVSTRADHAALTTDLIRNRLARDGGDAFVSGAPARFTRDELKNPGSAVGVIARGGSGGGTGKGSSGSPAVDLTSFFRRDPELPNTIRERVARRGVGDADASGGERSSISRREGGSASEQPAAGVIRRGGSAGNTPGEGAAPSHGTITRRGGGSDQQPSGGGIVTRPTPSTRDEGAIERPREDGGDSWRATPRVRRGGDGAVIERDRGESDSSVRRRAPQPERGENESWRRAAPRDEDGSVRRERPSTGSDGDAKRGSDDTPRRVIDRIGGTMRVSPSDRASRGSESTSSRPRPSSPRSERVERPRASSSSSPSSQRPSSSSSRSGESKSSNIKPD